MRIPLDLRDNLIKNLLFHDTLICERSGSLSFADIHFMTPQNKMGLGSVMFEIRRFFASWMHWSLMGIYMPTNIPSANGLFTSEGKKSPSFLSTINLYAEIFEPKCNHFSLISNR